MKRLLDLAGRAALLALALGALMAADSRGVLIVRGNGTAGSADANVVTVQGVASMTALSTTPAQATASNLNAQVVGNVASGSAASGNPVQVGGIARAQGSAPATVSGGQVASAITDLAGRLFVNNVHPNMFSCTVNAATALTQCQATPGASLSLYLTDYIVINNSTTASNIQLGSGTGTNCATTFTQITPTNTLPSNAGAGAVTVVPFNTPIKLAANTELCCKNATGSTSFSCLANGFTAP